MIWTANGLKRRHAVAHRSPGAGEVNHQRAAGNPGKAAGHAGVDDACRKTGRAQRLGDAEQFAIEDVAGRFWGDVARGDTCATDRHHQVHSPDHRGVERVADLHLVGGDHDHAVDHEPRLTEQFGDQRTAVVLLAVSGAVVDDDDERPAHQLPWLFHECNRISGQRTVARPLSAWRA